LYLVEGSFRKRKDKNMMPDVNDVIAWENGELDEEQTVEFFAGLIRSGLVWQLQGVYGRTARDLIEAGLVSPEGEVL
jgi:hypothetical protein